MYARVLVASRRMFDFRFIHFVHVLPCYTRNGVRVSAVRDCQFCIGVASYHPPRRNASRFRRTMASLDDELFHAVTAAAIMLMDYSGLRPSGTTSSCSHTEELGPHHVAEGGEPFYPSAEDDRTLPTNTLNRQLSHGDAAVFGLQSNAAVVSHLRRCATTLGFEYAKQAFHAAATEPMKPSAGPQHQRQSSTGSLVERLQHAMSKEAFQSPPKISSSVPNATVPGKVRRTFSTPANMMSGSEHFIPSDAPFGYRGVTRPLWSTRWESFLVDTASGKHIRIFLGTLQYSTYSMM